METLGKSHRQIITFNNEIGYSYIPNLKARLINSEGGYFIRTNSQGFRSDIEYEIKKRENKESYFSVTLIQPGMELVIWIDFLNY